LNGVRIELAYKGQNHTALAQAALDGAISLDTTSARLDEVGVAWRRLAEGAPEKQIVVP
jgi:hypothetical protein